ncbi:hypothetical protein [Pseudomonas boanensis]|uniref:hypothetical protein n=1 Tax=Metapseudomonas boanensis TaxID=2822138 RepID=UPI0035D4A092
MGLEDRDWLHEERAKKEAKTWKRPGRFMPPSASSSDNGGPIEGINRPVKQPTSPSYVHLQAQEILAARNSKSPPPRSLAVLLFMCLSVAVTALYLYF